VLSNGIKFWRFNHDYRKQGIFDKIYGVLEATKQDITDPEKGRDLLVMIARDQNNRPTVASGITPVKTYSEITDVGLTNVSSLRDHLVLKSLM
jgi:hypothetical protein